MKWIQDNNCVTVPLSGGVLALSFPEGGGIRLRFGPENSASNWCPVLEKEPKELPFTVEERIEDFRLLCGEWSISLSSTGKLILTRQGERIWETAENAFSLNGKIVSMRFRMERQEKIYGLGQDPMARLDHNGQERRMWNQWGGHERSGNCGIGFLTSTAGYGLLLAQPSAARFCMNESEPQPLDPLGEAMVPSPFAPAAPQPEGTALVEVLGFLDLFVFSGSPETLIKQYYKLTGLPKLLPKWAYGFLQCKNRYKNRDDLLKTARRMREEGIPCDGLIIDWLWFQEFGDLEWSEDWPDAAGMLDELEKLGFHVSSAQHPFISEQGKYYDFYQKHGFLNRVPGGKRVTFDHTNPEASAHWWQKTAKLYRQGLRGYWTDMGELEEHFEGTESAAGGRSKTHNAYSLLWAKGLHEGQKRDFGTRAFILSRSGCAGIQKYGVAMWSGDVNATWQVL